MREEKEVREKRLEKFIYCSGVNAFLVPIFWGHFYFGPYISILPFLVLKMKNAFHFGPYCHSLNGNILRGKQSALLTL